MTEGGRAGSCLRRNDGSPLSRNDGSLLRGYDGEERGADGEGAREVREAWVVSEPALLRKRDGLGWGGGLGGGGRASLWLIRKCALPLCGAANEWTCR